MGEILELSDSDFSAQMHGLIKEASQAIEERAAAVRHGEASRGQETENRQNREKSVQAYISLPDVLRPLVIGLEAITRATAENTLLLKKIEHSSGAKPAPAAPATEEDLPKLVTGLQTMVDQKNAISRQMFDALHEELKSYKDGFLLDSIHRPMIRDLISLYDDLSEIHRQLLGALSEETSAGTPPPPILETVKGIEMHMEHHLDFILEVLARLEVTQMPVGTGKLDKKIQRAVAVEMADDPNADLDVVRSVKRGFLWKDRVMRAEEVIIRKWKEGFLMVLPSGDV